MKTSLAILAGILVFGVLEAAETGKPAPDFTAQDIQGKTHRLTDYKGKIVVLESLNLDCPFCHNHYATGAMQDLQKELTGKGIAWFVVNSVSPKNPSHRPPEAAQKEWAAQKMAATAWLDDSSGEVGRAYGMRTTPDMFVIDANGVLVYQGAIDDRAADKGDPRTARNYVREVVTHLLSGQRPEVTDTKPYGCGVKYGS